MNQKEQILELILSKEAMERFKRIKMYHKTKGERIEHDLVGLYNSGQIKGQISDSVLVNFLENYEKNPDEDCVVTINRKKRDWDLDDF